MKTIACPLQKIAATQGSRKALITSNRTLTYNGLHQLVLQTENRLKKIGVKPKERVGLYLPNSAEYVILLIALWRIGAIAVPLNIYLPLASARAQMKALNAQRLINNTRLVPDLTIHSNNIYSKHSFPVGQNLTIMFTSGTTSTPKAALHAFGNYYYNAKGANEHIPFRKNDRWLLTLPLYHVGGINILFRALLGGGAIVVPAEKGNIAQAIKRYGITHISVVTTQLHRLLSQKFSSASLKTLKCILVGGGPVPITLIRQAIAKRYPVYATYGLTEMTSQVATSDKLTSMPRQIEAKILRYRKVKIAVDGEILVRGQTLFKGYLQGNRPRLPLTKQGWFKTGDIGQLPARKYLTVLGRRDNMFISGGENIQPKEIEKHLLHIAGIEKARVLAKDDLTFGKRPVAFIKLKGNAAANKERILKELSKTLPKYKLPDELSILP
ncbi:MAG TPA: o-succinylbenzoate--CoA ligase [Candidatus Omnitrophota bacterium]|nr:o-succinylbenzoate--CoA ligase [Candidatus Omnitrophota bacterium]